MSVKIMARVWEQSKQRGSALNLMLALGDFANDQGVCWPKVETLARKTRLGIRQTQKLLADLVAAGEIEVKAILQGPGESNFYLVKVGDPSAAWPEGVDRIRVNGSAPINRKRVQRSAPIEGGGVQKDSPIKPKGVNPSSQKGESQFEPYKEEEPSIEPSDSPLEVPPELQAFHEVLLGTPGYEPETFRPSFFPKVLSYLHPASGPRCPLDLESVAIAIRDWVKKKKGREPASEGRIREWLKRDADPEKYFKPKSNGNGKGGANGCYHTRHI